MDTAGAGLAVSRAPNTENSLRSAYRTVAACCQSNKLLDIQGCDAVAPNAPTTLHPLVRALPRNSIPAAFEQTNTSASRLTDSDRNQNFHVAMPSSPSPPATKTTSTVKLDEAFEPLTPDGKQQWSDEATHHVAATEKPKTEKPGLEIILLMNAVFLVVFLVALDRTIIATAIPHITNEFQSFDDVGWYGGAYLLTCCALQLLFGKLYTLWPVKWVLMSSVVIFEIASAISGAALNSVVFIIGRAISGIGAAGIFAGVVRFPSSSLLLPGLDG